MRTAPGVVGPRKLSQEGQSRGRCFARGELSASLLGDLVMPLLSARSAFALAIASGFPAAAGDLAFTERAQAVGLLGGRLQRPKVE